MPLVAPVILPEMYKIFTMAEVWMKIVFFYVIRIKNNIKYYYKVFTVLLVVLLFFFRSKYRIPPVSMEGTGLRVHIVGQTWLIIPTTIEFK